MPASFGSNNSETGVTGTSISGRGVEGRSDSEHGVLGQSNSSRGVGGVSRTDFGVFGVSDSGQGVRGQCETGIGVFGGSSRSQGVFGQSNSSEGVRGQSEAGIGVFGGSNGSQGVFGQSNSGEGVRGQSETGIGVFAASSKGISLLVRGGTLAGRFEGSVEVTGDIRFVNADCAEDFDVASADKVEPGTVMVMTQNGCLIPSNKAYDKKVVGVISGCGQYKPAVVLDRHEGRENRLAVALVGKVYCKVDAKYASIEVGDLLTTSPTGGHAMKAANLPNAFGAVIGKALGALTDGQGLIPILVALQ